MRSLSANVYAACLNIQSREITATTHSITRDALGDDGRRGASVRRHQERRIIDIDHLPSFYHVGRVLRKQSLAKERRLNCRH